jgi:hypothetical protein
MSFFQPPVLPLPPGYPLPALDANGVVLNIGMQVRILTIPHSLTHDLPRDEVARLKVNEGAVMPILAFDAYGMVWFGAHGPWFCLKPSEVVAVGPAPRSSI